MLAFSWSCHCEVAILLKTIGHPRRAVIRAIPLRRAAVFAELVADILDATEYWEQLFPGSLVLQAKVTGEALRVAGTPICRARNRASRAVVIDAPRLR